MVVVTEQRCETSCVELRDCEATRSRGEECQGQEIAGLGAID